ncbi:FxLYD domain-containing protein [Bacillus sp. JJ1773]
MYCHQCGEKLMEGSRFCSGCGSEVQARVEDEIKVELEEPETQTQNEEEVLTRSENLQQPNRHPMIKLIPIIAPILSIVLVGSGLAFFYFQELEINREVLKLKESAEELAIKNDFDKALKQLVKAQLKRPDYIALHDSKEVIEKALGYEQELSKISEKMGHTQYEAASKELARLKEQVNGEKAPLFEHFHQKIEESQTKITIGTIKKEINELATVNDLGGKLSVLATLPENEARVVKQEILKKIVKISSDQAENELANKQFSSAFTTIDKGLQFAVNDEKLLGLKNRVEQDKLAFEQAEQQRIEKAMEAAAKEDLQNRTAAVSVSDFSAETDEYGDLYIIGNVKNVATTSISSITIYYTIYNENGGFLSSGYTSVYPYYLEPGELGYFDNIYYGVGQNVNVEIDNITWYLN